MLSIQQLISRHCKSLKNVATATTATTTTQAEVTSQLMTSVLSNDFHQISSSSSQKTLQIQTSPKQPIIVINESSQQIQQNITCHENNENNQKNQKQLGVNVTASNSNSSSSSSSSGSCSNNRKNIISSVSYDEKSGCKIGKKAESCVFQTNFNVLSIKQTQLNKYQKENHLQYCFQPQQQIHNFYTQLLQKQQQRNFHSQNNNQSGALYAKQKQIQFAMSSLAAEPLAFKSEDNTIKGNCNGANNTNNGSNKDDSKVPEDVTPSATTGPKQTAAAPCFNTGFAEILQFMELIGNLKHTKRTGWVLRDVNDCESISGHMYRMSMMTFLLDGSEGLNQIRCMQLALVHDLAESLVGDITPFCGVSKSEKRAMEFKAMADICKLIEPRGKRIMELFEEYEEGQSAESRFVKDLDRLDMVMQAFEYEKRDNCLLKHQEFFDSTEGKFNHPFVKKLVNEIYEQRRQLARAKGATPPPPIHVPDMDDQTDDEPTNGHATATTKKENDKTNTTSS